MREFIFRGRVSEKEGGKFQDEWWYGDLIHCEDETIVIRATEDGMEQIVTPETVGMMLKNINGKKYFEGDIGKTTDKANLIVILAWIDEYSMCSWLTADEYKELQDGKLDFDKTMFWTYSFEDKYAGDIEVIGNIHDNPELIK